MKKITLLLVISIILNSCGSIERYNEAVTKLHPVEDLREDVDAVYKKLKRLHPHLYQFTPKETLDFKFDSLKAAMRKPMTSRKFHKELAKVTKFIGQGHMSVSPPNKRFNRKERKANNKLKFDINNLDTEYVENTLFIRNARGNDSLLKHAEILEVDGKPVKSLMSKYKEIIASDGYNKTFHNRVLGRRFLRYHSQYVGRFDSISLKLRNSDSTFIKKYKRLPKAKKTESKDSIKTDSLQIKEPKKKLTKTEKKANRLKLKKKFKERKKYGYNYSTKLNNRNLNFIGQDSTIAFMKIRGFSNGNYKAFYEEAFTKIDSAKSKHLVIDLRDNFGGRLSEISDLYSYLTDENFTFINLSETNSRIPLLKATMSNTSSTFSKIVMGILSPVIITHNLIKTTKKDGKLYYRFKSSKEQEPKPLNFKGGVYVLINGNSFSASSLISTQLKGSKRATFVGEETGGAYNGTVAGLYKVYELPNTKVTARIGLMHVDSKHKTNPDGFGIKPDVEILPTYQDRLDGVDPELQWVLNDIESKK